MANQNFDPNYNIQNRELRVFVSSTFDDMKEERQYLIDTVFPSIKQLCQKRGVDFIPIDLRWGITKKQAERGQVVEVCLKSVKECNVFIGLLGYRYGSKPELSDLKKNPKMKREFPFLEDDIKNQLSMTEIEMQYGVLQDPQQRISCFCFRSEIMQSEIEKSTTIEESSEDPIEESSEDKEKLDRLKEEIKSIKNRDTVSVYEYDSVEEMGFLVESFLKRDVVDKLFHAKATWFERQMAQQDFFIELKRKLYISREEDYKRLDDFMDSRTQYFAITGERGNGKSSLVANWMGTRPDLKFIYCFVGASENSFNPEDILKLLIVQLNPDLIKDGDDDLEIMLELESENKPKGKEDQPENWYDKYHAIFQRALRERHKANPDERIVLILDGINQISDYQNSKELQWVPKLPKDVKAIFTTWEDDRTNVSLKALGAETMNVEPLYAKQIREIIDRFLDDRGRSLSKSPFNRIVDDKESQSPIVLRTLLDEMCYYGDHNKLVDEIRSYVTTSSKEDFFKRVLKRLEDSFDPSRVSKLLVALVSSHSGLSNEELIGIANSLTKPPRSRSWDKLKSWILPSRMTGSNKCSLLDWKQICYSLDSHFIERGGRNYFSHDLIASAAESRYEANIPNVRSLIVEYMKSSGSFERQCDEIPWQLSQLEKWSELNEFFLNPDVLKCMLDKSDFNLYLWYLYDNENSLDEYFTLDLSRLKPDDRFKIYRALAAFGASINNVQISERGLTEARDVLLNNSDSFEDKEMYSCYLADVYYRLGSSYYRMGIADYGCLAEDAYSKALNIYENLKKKNPAKYGLTAAVLSNDMGLLHLDMNCFEKSEKELSVSLEFYNNCNDVDKDVVRFFSALSLLNRGLLFLKNNLTVESEADFSKALEIFQDLNKENSGGFEDEIVRVQMDLGLLYTNIKQISKAEDCLNDALDRIKRLIDNRPESDFELFLEFGTALLNMGWLNIQKDCYEDAKTVLWDALNIFQRLNTAIQGSQALNIAKTQINLGIAYLCTGSASEAKNLFDQSKERYCQLVDKNPNTYKLEYAGTLIVRGDFCLQKKFYSKAEEDYNEALIIYRQLAVNNPDVYKPAVADVLSDLARTHLKQNRDSEAKDELNEAVNICRSLKESEDSLIFAGGELYCLAHIYKEDLHDYSRCKELLLESRAAYEKLNKLHPGEYEDCLNAVRDSLKYLEEDENGSSNKD